MEGQLMLARKMNGDSWPLESGGCWSLQQLQELGGRESEQSECWTGTATAHP